MPLQIIEILGPSDQGKCIPYRCRGDDGALYYVKGRQTNRASLWHEWICAHLAQSLALNIPPFEIVELSSELLTETPPQWRDIGVGPAFGSRLHPSAAWLEPSKAKTVPAQTQRDVLVFDWWVRNNDRMIGNPNLLWDAAAKELVVIDHNLAFDPDFSAIEFAEHHVFAGQWDSVRHDLVSQAEYATRLNKALAAARSACDNAPPEWAWANIEMDIPAQFNVDAVLTTLARCATPELWSPV